MKRDVILLVEDNPDDVKQTLRSFARNNIANEVVVARDGAEALDYLFGTGPFSGRDVSLQPSLVLLDLKLPRVSGFEVLERLRADARTQLIPIVVLTSSWEEQDMLQSYSLGANIYVRKPVHFTQFLNAARFLGLYWTLLESGLALLHREKPVSSELASEDAGVPPIAGLSSGVDIVVGTADRDLCRLATAVLRADGHRVRHGHDAHDVIRLLFSYLPQILILESRLPDIPGNEIVRALREPEAGRDVSAILLVDDVTRARDDVADPAVRILGTPVEILDLAELVQGIVAERAVPQRGAAPREAAGRPTPTQTPTQGGSAWDVLGVADDAPSDVIERAADALLGQLTELATRAKSVAKRSHAAATAARVRSARTELLDRRAHERRGS